MHFQPITIHRFSYPTSFSIKFCHFSLFHLKPNSNFPVELFSLPVSRWAVSPPPPLMAAPASTTLARKSARAGVPKDSAKKPVSEAPTAKANKATAPKKTRVHPPYYEMIKEAIMALKERTGSSQYAIAKFIEENQKDLPPNFKKLLLVQLKKFVASGKLAKVKNSFKLSPVPKPTSVAAEKPKKEPTKKVTAAKKPAAATSGKPKKVAPATKDAAKKKVTAKGGEEKGKKRKAVAAAPKMKKTPVKKPKSIKSPTKKLKK